MRFRSNLTTRAKNITSQRKKKAKTVLKPVNGKVQRVLDYVALRVKVVIVSDSQVAFQFYEGDELPDEPQAGRVAVPVVKRKNLHAPRTTRRHVKVLA